MTSLERSLAILITAAPKDRDDWWLIGSAATVGSQSERFRSTPFKSLKVDDGLPIEFMGDLHVFVDDKWQTLQIKTRVPVITSQGTVYVPSLPEQKAVFQLFGRPKDLAKAAMIG